MTTTVESPALFWVKLRRWHMESRAFEYMTVIVPATRFGTSAAGESAETQHRGWYYVEVWSMDPEALRQQKGKP